MLTLLEVRDIDTTIPVIAISLESDDLNDQELWLLRKAGYQAGKRVILVGQLAGGNGQLTSDPFDWTAGRTMREAHKYIRDHFDRLDFGQVIDVEYILRETNIPKVSDRESEGC